MTTATEQTKLELLQASEAELAIAVDEARSRIAEYPALLHDARSRAICAKPNVRPGAELNSEVSKLNAKERKDVDGLRALEADLSACRGVIAIEAQRVTEEEKAAAREQTRDLHAKEEATWKQAGDLFGELAAVWNELVEIIETEDRFAQANGLEGSVVAVEPTPSTFKAFLLLLNAASTDPEVRAEDFIEHLIDSGAFRTEHGASVYDVRPAGTRQVEVRRRLDNGDRLFFLLPDLRTVVRAPSLSGGVPTISS